MSRTIDGETSPREQNRTPRAEAVLAFMLETLADGAVTVLELGSKARQAGLLSKLQDITHAKMFKQAKKTLGIRSVRDGFGAGGEWMWVLPRQSRGSVTDAAAHRLGLRVAPTDPYASPGIQQEIFTRATDSSAGTPVRSQRRRIPPDWINGVARLDNHRAPAGIRLHRWRQFVDDCNNFLSATENGAERAASLDWDTFAVFGCGPAHPLEHLGASGLLWHINGGRVVELRREWAVVELAAGAGRHIFNRQRIVPAIVTFPWELRFGLPITS